MNSAYVTYTDVALLALWRQKDEAAFESFYKRHFLKMVAEAVRLVNDQQLAEELVQDSFVVLYTNSNTVINPVAYCRRVLKYKVARYYRNRLKLITPIDETQVNPRDSAGVASPIEYKELEAQVLQHISVLPEQCRRVFLLRREGNLTTQEVAERLNISIKTVEAHMTKAMAILRERLEYYAYFSVLIGIELLK